MAESRANPVGKSYHKDTEHVQMRTYDKCVRSTTYCTVHTVNKIYIAYEESYFTAYSNGRKFLYNSKGLDVISLLVKY